MRWATTTYTHRYYAIYADQRVKLGCIQCDWMALLPYFVSNWHDSHDCTKCSQCNALHLFANLAYDLPGYVFFLSISLAIFTSHQESDGLESAFWPLNIWILAFRCLYFKQCVVHISWDWKHISYRLKRPNKIGTPKSQSGWWCVLFVLCISKMNFMDISIVMSSRFSWCSVSITLKTIGTKFISIYENLSINIIIN